MDGLPNKEGKFVSILAGRWNTYCTLWALAGWSMGRLVMTVSTMVPGGGLESWLLFGHYFNNNTLLFGRNTYKVSTMPAVLGAFLECLIPTFMSLFYVLQYIEARNLCVCACSATWQCWRCLPLGLSAQDKNIIGKGALG